ncbi:MAG: hypothetical protein IT423_11930 [Pirellulaceae bacterium]|nr:hypothetical protein [Pirellulaceae bacterium]
MVSVTLLLPLLLCASGGIGGDQAVREAVDLIELNHFYDDLGRHTYDQVIFYEWSVEYSRYHVIAWCLVEDDQSRLPVLLPGGRQVQVRWYDRDVKRYRDVRSPLFRETWTQTDPERENKKLLEEKYRSSLLKVPQLVR